MGVGGGGEKCAQDTDEGIKKRLTAYVRKNNYQPEIRRCKDRTKNLYTMSYNRINKLKMYQKIQEITMKEYEPYFTTYKGVWRKFIYPVYFVSYKHYLNILAEGGLEERIEQEEERAGKQMELF